MLGTGTSNIVLRDMKNDLVLALVVLNIYKN